MQLPNPMPEQCETTEFDPRGHLKEVLPIELVSVDGGFVRDAIGRRFRGKKPGTWRMVKETRGALILWTNERGRKGSCWISTFMAWVDRTKPAVLGGGE